jgi:hypothetical protein
MAIPPDEQGLVDRECPECRSRFKVDAAHLEAHTGKLTCPYDGHSAPASEWTASAHVKQAKEQVKQFAHSWFQSTLKGTPTPPTAIGIESLSRRPDGTLGGTTLPARVLDLLAQERSCAQCNCRFAFIGAAFFCPLCGNNSADATFDQTIANIRRSIAALPEICRGLDPDTSAEVRRVLLEKHLQDTVTAFQRVGESLYLSRTGTTAPLNAFQRLDGGTDGNTLWQTATGRSYEASIGQDDLREMRVFFQKRHSLAHCDGIVDQRYLDRSGDATYSLGQRIRITDADVLRFAEIVVRLVAEMRSTLTRSATPP